MSTIKLAFRNIISAGVRTWLNVIVLSVAFVSLIWLQGLMAGVFDQMKFDTIDSELGGGQFWHQAYDPFDPMTLEDAHGSIPPELSDLVSHDQALPILITMGAIFPEGRMQTALIKGILPGQRILTIPTSSLKQADPDIIPALIGSRMADQTRLKIGDEVTIRWRDIHGTFDAVDIRIADIMHLTNPAVDSGQVWLPLSTLQEMLQAPGEATLVVLKKKIESIPAVSGPWIHQSLKGLVKTLDMITMQKKAGASVMSSLILAMALLAIFDTQVLAIFRRRREMGTLMALGMARKNLVGLFTLEGAFHGILALIVGAVYGIPLMALTAVKGIPFPDMAGKTGMAMASRMYPVYGMPLLVGATALVLATVTFVSYLPTRRVSKLKPTDALKGKMS